METILEILSSDGRHSLTVERQAEGLCRFTEWTLTEGDEYTGTHWAVTHWSGLYATPADAEADARETFPWFRNQASS